MPNERTADTQVEVPRIVVFSTSPRIGQSSNACIRSANRLRAAGFHVDEFDARQLPRTPAGLGEEYPPAYLHVQQTIAVADAIVIGAPVHYSAPAGATRNLLELLRDVLAGKLALPLLAAGSLRSHLVGSAFQADLILNFGLDSFASVLITPDGASHAIDRQIDRAVDTLAQRVRSVKR